MAPNTRFGKGEASDTHPREGEQRFPPASHSSFAQQRERKIAQPLPGVFLLNLP